MTNRRWAGLPPTTAVVRGVVALMVLVAGACAPATHQVDLRPAVTIEPAGVGHSRPVALRIADRRASRTFGYHHAGGNRRARIFSSQDVAAVVREQVARGLEAHGFGIVPGDADAARQLTVEVRDISYHTHATTLKTTLDGQTVLAAVARSGAATLERTFTVDSTETKPKAPFTTTYEERINRMLSEALTRLLNDDELLGLLAR